MREPEPTMNPGPSPWGAAHVLLSQSEQLPAKWALGLSMCVPETVKSNQPLEKSTFSGLSKTNFDQAQKFHCIVRCMLQHTVAPTPA